MAWKGKTKDPVDFNHLLATLQNSRIHQSNNALWQTIQQLILLSQQQKGWSVDQFTTIIGELVDNSNTVINIKQNLDDASFWTKNDETLTFPSALQVLAGFGIILDYSVANKVTISIASAVGDHVVMSDGASPIPNPVNDGFGNFIYIPYSE